MLDCFRSTARTACVILLLHDWVHSILKHDVTSSSRQEQQASSLSLPVSKMIGLKKYVGLSTLAAAGVVYHAFSTREQCVPVTLLVLMPVPFLGETVACAWLLPAPLSS